jgi:hypothetical protein
VAKTSGKDGEVRAGAVVIASVQTFSLDLSEAQSPVGAMGEEFEEVVGGLKTATGSMSLLYNYGSPGQDLIVVGSELDATFDVKKDQVGSKRITARIRISKVGLEVPYNDAVKKSVEFHCQSYAESSIS